jgi:hypothetical protein
MSRALSVLILAILASVPKSGKPQKTRSVDVCQAIASPGDFDGHQISIHGNFEKDLEHTDLTSQRCQKEIAVLPTKAAAEDPGFKAILAVYYGPPF